MSDYLLTVNNLNISLKTDGKLLPLVMNANFRIRREETFVLLGESGSGKTLTSLSIMQLLQPPIGIEQGSEIFLEQQNLLQLSEVAMRDIRGRRIGMIFQEPMTSLNPVFTVGHQIDEVLRCHMNLTQSAARQRTLELLDEVGIHDPKACYQEYPHQLSGGMQQRIMIAMAIAAEPDLLIADEATTALDVVTQNQILDLLKQLQKKIGMSILLITHDLNVAKQVADQIAVMYQGKIVEQNVASQFFLHPTHPYSHRLFAVVPDFNKRGKPLGDDHFEGGEGYQEVIQPIQDDMADRSLLNVTDLKIYFPIRKGIFKRTVGYVKAVDGLSFTIPKGKTLALIGESGSGKSTIGKGIMQLLPITAGHVTFQNHDVTLMHGEELQQCHKAIQMIFQDPYGSLNPRMQIGDIIAEGMDALNIVSSVKEREQRIEQLLQQVGLPIDSQYRYPHEFSGGQRQRISIARALAVKPQLIVCDEPTSALDVVVQAQILNLLRKLQQDLSLSYLFITHNMAVVAYLADTIIVLQEGKIVEQGTVAEILFSPKHPYTQVLVQSAGCL